MGITKKRWRLALGKAGNHDVTLEQAQMATVFRFFFPANWAPKYNVLSCLRTDEKCIASDSPHLLLASYVRPTPKPKHQYTFIAAGSIHADTDIDNRYWILDKGMCVCIYIYRYMRMFVDLYMCMFVYGCIFICIFVCGYRYKYKRTYIILYIYILYTILYIILYYIILCYIMLYYIVLYYIILGYITLHYITSYHIISYHIISYYIILYYIYIYVVI